MLVVSPVWLAPQPVIANVQEPQTVAQISVQEVAIPPIEQLPRKELQPADNQPIQEIKLDDSITKNESLNTRVVKQVSKTSFQLPTSKESYSGRNYSKEEVQALIISYSAEYGISPEAPLCIAQKESGFHQFSANRSSSAKGVFQYLSSTWKATDEGKAGFSVFDAEQNVKAAIKYMAIHKSTKPWTVAKSCPKLTFL